MRRFFVRLFAEIIAVGFVVFMTTKLINSGHPRAGVVFAAFCAVALALRATIQSEHIKDDARERRRLEKAFAAAVEDAGWPNLVTVHHDRKVVAHYIENPFGDPDDIFYFELPLKEESLAEQVQLIDLLPPEKIDELYAGADEVEDEDEEVNDTTTAEEE